MKYNGLNELRSIAEDDLDRPIFNRNFNNITVATLAELRESSTVKELLRNRDIEIVCAEIGCKVSDISYGVYTPTSVVLVFKTVGNYTMWADGTQFMFTNKHGGWLTWSRLQAMYHHDVHYLNHSKHAPAPPAGQLTLHQILTKRVIAGRLSQSLRKSRQR